MTRKLFLTLAVALFFLAGVHAQTAPATAGSAAKIGVVHIQAAIVGTNEGRRDFESLEKKFEPKRLELKSASDEIDSLKKQLTASQDKLSEDERASRLKAIETKQKNLQRSFEDAQNEFQGQQNEMAKRVGQKVLDVLDKYARTNGYTVILDISSEQSPVLWAGESVNITQAIVDAYNAQSNVPAQKPSARPAPVRRPAPPPKR